MSHDMNCQEFWDSMPELGEPESSGHPAECAACAAALTRQRALRAGLRKVAGEMRGIEAPAHLEAQLLKSFRSQSKVVPIRPRRHWLQVAAWGSAAAAVIATGLFLAPKQHPAPPRHSAHGNADAIQLAALMTPAAVSGYEDADSDGFIPLPDAQQVGPNEDVNVVRVEMPRSAMMAVGIDVSDDRASERVEADIMLGSDGLPRAVRFVEPEGE